MVMVEVRDAEGQLAKLIERAGRGEDIVLSLDGQPVARIAPLEDSAGERLLGLDRGSVVVPPEFFDPLPDDIARAFGVID
jgi:prevent-host-death family protein